MSGLAVSFKSILNQSKNENFEKFKSPNLQNNLPKCFPITYSVLDTFHPNNNHTDWIPVRIQIMISQLLLNIPTGGIL